MRKRSLYPALVLSTYIVLSMLVCVIRFCIATGDGNMKVHGWQALQFFTVQSNLLMAAAAAMTVISILRQLKDPAHRFSRWLVLFNYVCVTAVSVTFLVVCLILGPAAGFFSMFTGTNFMMHLLNPLAAIASFMFFTASYKISWKQTPLSMITTFLYGLLYSYMVVYLGSANGGWNDFYYFNVGGRGLLSFLVIQAIAYLAGIGLRAVHNHSVRKCLSREL